MQLIKIKRKLNKKFVYKRSFDDIRKIISDHRINFFIGTSFSSPLLKPQRNIDLILNAIGIGNKNYYKVKAYLLWNFFHKSIYPLLQLDLDIMPQKQFTHNIKSILTNDAITLLTKQINVFTTNFDPLLEMGFNKKNDIEYNDGLFGKTVPVFSIDNYMDLKTDQILYYDDHNSIHEEAGIQDYTDKPVIDIFKLHGSLTWRKNSINNNIEYVDYHTIIFNFNNKYREIFDSEITNDIDILSDQELNERKTIKTVKRIFRGYNSAKLDKYINQFLDDFYNTFMIVDPITRKFLSVELEVYYRKLLKVFQDELSKEKALLLVFGSLFKDEHIRQTILNVLKCSSLSLFIFCKNEAEVKKFQSYFTENNDRISLIYPSKTDYTLYDFNYFLELINKNSKK